MTHNAAYDVFTFLCCIFLILGVSSQIVTIIVATSDHNRVVSSTPFIVNIAIANLVTIFCCYPIAIASSISSKWVGGGVLCDITGYGTGASCMVSIVTIFAFAHDINCLVNANHANVNTAAENIHTTKARVVKILVTIWGYSLLCLLPPLIGWSEMIPLSAGTNCAPNWAADSANGLSYLVFLMFNAFAWPVAGTIYLLYKTHKMLKASHLADSNATLMTRHLKYKRLVKVISSALIVNCISWVPYVIYSLILSIKGESVSSVFAEMIPAYIAKASCLVNPAVYMVFDARYVVLICFIFFIFYFISNICTFCLNHVLTYIFVLC